MNQEIRVVRIPLLPLVLGFVLLGALSHTVALRFEQPQPAAAEAPVAAAAPSAAELARHVRELSEGGQRAAKLQPGQALDRCAAAAGAADAGYVCSWSI